MGDLERHLPVDPGVLGKIDGPEAAAAERGRDAVFAEHLSSEQHKSKSSIAAQCDP